VNPRVITKLRSPSIPYRIRKCRPPSGQGWQIGAKKNSTLWVKLNSGMVFASSEDEKAEARPAM
jgi:hypothetical protein